MTRRCARSPPSARSREPAYAKRPPPGSKGRQHCADEVATAVNQHIVTQPAPTEAEDGARPLYGASPVKRQRRTNAELAELDAVIVQVIAADNPVTLRGVYYRVVSQGAVEKTEAGYQLVGRQLLKLRRGHVVPYASITDGTRWVIRPTRHSSVEDMLDDTAASYRRMLWDAQDCEVHIFTEKDAISGVIAPVTAEWDVPLAVLRGYCSESFAYELGQAVAAARKPVFIYQLGDHDPSGLDAWRDLQKKVTRFAPNADVTFTRLAVTLEQIDEFNLPTRPTKTTDTRAGSFRGGSVEVDAIPARWLRALVGDAITQHIDPPALRVHREIEAEERNGIRALAGAWVNRGEGWWSE